MQWNLYITKWANGQFSVNVRPCEPDEVDWFDTLDCEGDPAAAEVRRIAPCSEFWIRFEESGDTEQPGLFHATVVPEPSSLAEAFDQSTEVVWPK